MTLRSSLRGRGAVPALLLSGSCAIATPREPPADVCARAAMRLESDINEDRPIVAHVFVVLADNDAQGIVPIPRRLGNGADIRNNLYWGARYGVRTHLIRDAGWIRVEHASAPPSGVLERLVLTTSITRHGRRPNIFMVADAWRGDRIRDALGAFLSATNGSPQPPIKVVADGAPLALPVGGSAHVVAYVGHNGLMDFEAPAVDGKSPSALPRAAIVLACASRPYFESLIGGNGACPLLLTNGLMAPEAYSLDAALRAWFTSGRTADVRAQAARAYDRYQKCGVSAAQRLFWSPE